MSDMQRWLNEGVQEGAPNMPSPEQATPTDFSNWIADDPQINQLTASMRSARDKSPDTQAEVFNLQARTGLPADTIQRNLDIVRRRTQDEDFDARAFRDQWPKIAEYLSDPDNASVSYDDIESMGLLESSIKQANDRYNRDTTLGQRVWDRVREGITGFRASMAALPSAVTMGQTSGGTEQNREIGRDPITGMPIYASEVTFGDEQQQQLSEATTDIGRAAGIELARQIAPIQERLRDIDTRPATQAMMQSESWGDVLEAFKLDPLGIVADIGISSTVQQLPALAAIIATRSPAVAVAASGGNAYALELGGGVADYLSKEGIDTTDTAAVIQALESDETAQAAVEYAERRAAIIGSVAGLAGGVAARNLAPSSIISNQTAREGANIFVAQPVAQGFIGGSGEAGAQLATEGSISPGEVFAEAIGEFSGAPVDAAAFAVERIRSRPPKLVNDAINASNAEGTAATMAELGEAARNSRTMTRDPERFKALIQRITENGGFDSVQIPVAQWNELFQSRNMDPADVANQVLGGYKQYNEASESGADIVVPMDAFLEGFANQDYYAELSDHVRIAPGDMTPAEARQWEGNVEELVRSYAEEAPAEQSSQVYEDMLGQLLSAGRDRSTAEQEATLTQAVFRSLGERSGRDPMELYQSYNINVSRPLPEVLRNAGEDFDVAIDPLLDRLRSGDVPTQQDVFGTSLMEFVRERGVRDEGGELSGRDIDAQRRAFQRSILREDGQTLDEVAQAAAEAGYITGRDVSTVTQQDLLSALDRELGGDPVYAAGVEDTALQEVQGTLEQLSNYLDELGIDLATMDNATIRQMLEGQEGAQADGETWLYQSDFMPPDPELAAREVFKKAVKINAVYKPDSQRYGMRPENLPPNAESMVAEEIAGDGYFYQYKDGSYIFVSNDGVVALVLPDRVFKMPENMQENAMRRLWDDANERSPDPERDASRDRNREAIREQQRRIQRLEDTPELTGDLMEDLQKLSEWSESFEEFQAAITGNMLDTSNRNRTRLGRAAIALDESQNVREFINGEDSSVIQSAIRSSQVTERETAQALLNADDTITIYRGQPVGQEIGAGDWVALSETYARTHETNVETGDAETISQEVPVEDVYWYGADIHEWVYIPSDTWGNTESLLDFWRQNGGDGKPESYTTSLNQSGSGRQGAPRGRITFPQSRAFFNIELLEGANLSTFIHESGHLYLEIMRDLAQREDAPQQIRDDFQSVLNWFGVQDADSIATEQHEQWARGFEAYIMEGKAPSAELRSTFARFRAWMVAIYRSLSSLNVKLTDEVRGVMDRLVATDAEISEAQYEAGQAPIFDSAESAGMTQAEYAAYRRYAERARDEAEDRLTRKVMDEYQRTTRKWWRDARRSMRDTVASEVNQRPEYVAMSVMGRGKLPDGSDLPEGFTPFKLHRQALVDMYGKDFLKRLPRPYVYTREGGVHPDVAAQNFGYNSGDQMIQAMVSARPRRELIDAETDRRMLEQYGDMLNNGTMAEQALRDVHNQTRASVIQQEFSALARRTGMKGTPREIIRDAAKDIISRKVVRDVRPGLYLSAERKASSEAFKALARQDYRGAAEAKQRQLLNHYLYREAATAKADVDKLVAYTSRLGKKPAQQRLAKAGEEYQQQINQLLERYEFKRVPMRQIDRRRSLEAWIQEQQEQGFTVDVPDDVMNDSRVINYREVPVEELRGIRDALRQIEHLARTKNKLLTARDKRDFQELIDGVVASIDSNRTRSNAAPPLHENFADKIASFARDAHAWHTKPEFLARWLDGDVEQGPVWQALFRPIADAESAQQALTFEKTNELREIMNAYTRQERAEWYSKGPYIPEVGQNVPKFFAISVALNWGNEYNRQVLLERYTPAQVEAMLNQLDQRDWNTVQGVWDLIDSLWPATEQLEKDLNGIAPQKVQAMPVETRFGTFKGGYYPIKYDARVSNQTFQNEERSAARLFENSFTRPATQRGHTKERQGSNGQVLRLDLNVISEHLGQVIHDVTHRRAVMDVNRMIENRQVREAIEETAGREMYRQLKPWLQAVANETQQPESYWEKLVGRARVGATVVNMGLKATTALAQPLGFFSSIDVLGERYAWKGLTDFWGARGNRDGGSIWRNMKDSTAFVQERSVMMQQRQQTYDRDVRDTLQRMTQETRAQELGRFYFYFTGLLDMSVSVPTWLGAYRKAMDGQLDNVAAGNEVEAIAYADSIVRMSQSAGTVANLARIQRGGQVQRAFVMFYSFFNVLYNQGARRISQAKRGEISKQQMAASMMYLWIVPALLGELVAGRGPDEDDEEWAKWAATQGILYPAGTMVGMRDVVSGVLTPYGYDASPAYDAFEQSARAARIPLKLLDEDQDVTRGDVKAAFMATGYWAALPSRQAWITGEYLYDIATGEEEPETPQEFVRNLFFVRPQN